ncbi:MAG: hypothetical protein ACNA7W_13535 [Pseudomonadales bacterium]
MEQLGRAARRRAATISADALALVLPLCLLGACSGGTDGNNAATAPHVPAPAATANAAGGSTSAPPKTRLATWQASRSISAQPAVATCRRCLSTTRPPPATSHQLMLPPATYFIAMTAVDADGNESGYSNEIVEVLE